MSVKNSGLNWHECGMNIMNGLVIPLISLMLLTSCSASLTPLPAEEPTPPRTQAPAPATQQAIPLTITSVTSPVSAGGSATLVARTAPGAECAINVYYKSGPSSASGLYDKTADSSGRVSWTWKVGGRTTPGSWRIVVTATSQGETVSETTYFTVR